MVTMFGKEVNMKSLDFDGIDHADAPDYCDAYVVYGEFANGDVMTEAELEALMDNHYVEVDSALRDWLI